MNSVERVKSICKERKIAISRLERELGFSNGYIAQLRKGTFPADRLADIAAYLSVSTEYLLTGENKNAPALTEKDRRNGIEKNMNVLRIAGRDGSFEERVLTDDQMATVKAFLNLLPDASDDL